MVKRVDVPVKAYFTSKGDIIPLSIIWKDGTEYQIDKVTDIVKAASLKAGGCGLRYTVFIEGKQTYLFYEDPMWFVEEK